MIITYLLLASILVGVIINILICRNPQKWIVQDDPYDAENDYKQAEKPYLYAERNAITEEILNSRPDLSFITKNTFKTREDYVYWYGQLSEIEMSIVWRCSLNLPALIYIAEMYHDTMVGTEKDKSVAFQIVKSTLDKISN